MYISMYSTYVHYAKTQAQENENQKCYITCPDIIAISPAVAT